MIKVLWTLKADDLTKELESELRKSDPYIFFMISEFLKTKMFIIRENVRPKILVEINIK